MLFQRSSKRVMENLQKKADDIIDLYGPDTAASIFAQQVKDSLKGYELTPHVFGEYSSELKESSIPSFIHPTALKQD